MDIRQTARHTGVEDVVAQRLHALQYVSANGVKPLPAWCRYFIDVGIAVAMHRPVEQRIVAVIAVPTKAYAALLLLSAAVTWLAAAKPTTDQCIHEHIEMLRRLPKGTPLVYRTQTNHIKRGTLQGWVGNGGEPYICMRMARRGKLTSRFPPEATLGIEPMARESYKVSKDLSVRKVVPDSEFEFLKAVLGDEIAGRHVSMSRNDCAVVGSAKTLREEAALVEVVLPRRRGNPARGQLSAIARLQCTQSGDVPCRTAVISAASAPDGREQAPASAVAVFSGSLAFLKWRHSFPLSNWVVVLDRTEARFGDAVAEANQEYIQRRSDSLVPVEMPVPPPGVETMVFMEDVG